MRKHGVTPPLHWLKAFEVSARKLSFTAAAEELLITQSAVSKQVKNLEYHLDQALFQRGQRGLHLTEAGRNYLPTVIRAFNSLEQGTRSFLNYSSGNKLHVKCNYAFASFWLCHHITEFMDLHPQVEFTISPALWEQDFSDSTADIEIHYGKKDWFPETAIQLTQEQLVPVCTPEIGRRLASPSDLEHERILDLTGISDNWDYWVAETGQTGVRLDKRHYFGTFVLALNMTLEGNGVTLANQSLVQRWLDNGDLVVALDIPVPSRDNYFMLQSQIKVQNPNADVFQEWLAGKLSRSGKSF